MITTTLFNQEEYNKACDNIIVDAVLHGLAFEVIESAFKHKTQFPDAPLLQCLQVGADEWDV
jgi:hypothetical protein